MRLLSDAYDVRMLCITFQLLLSALLYELRRKSGFANEFATLGAVQCVYAAATDAPLDEDAGPGGGKLAVGVWLSLVI